MEPRIAPPKPRQANEHLYVLTFRDLGSVVPIGCRLRKVLKYAKWESRLCCIEAKETPKAH
jgi:hypothetical protein